MSGSSCAAAAAANALDRVDVARRVHRGQHVAIDRRRARRARTRASLATSSSRSIATIRAACSGCAPVSCSSEDGCSRNTGAAAIASTVPHRCPDSRPRSPSSAPAPPACTRRCAPPRHGRAGDARLGDAAGRVLELLGAGRPRRGARPGRQPRAALRRHDRRRPRRRARVGGAASCATRRRPRSRTSPSLGVRFDADRHGGSRSGSRAATSARRIVHAGGAATGRRMIRQLSALVAQDERIEVLEGRRASRCRDRGRPRDRRLAGRRRRRSRAAAIVLATGGAAALWSRTTNPPGAVGGGLLLAYDAGAALADLELMQFHPTAVVAANGADGFLVTEAVRGEGARLLDRRGERFVDELAPRDEVARAVQREIARTGARAGRPRHARRRPGAVPERRQRAAARRDRPRARARPGRAGGALHDGRDRDRPRRARDARRACTRSASAPARACTAPTGWRRTRSPNASCSAPGPPRRRPRPATAARPEPRAARHGRGRADRAPPHARRCGATPGSSATRDGLRRLAEDPHPLVRLIAALGARTRRRAAAPTSARDFPELDPALDGRHVTRRRRRRSPQLVELGRRRAGFRLNAQLTPAMARQLHKSARILACTTGNTRRRNKGWRPAGAPKGA